MNLLLGLRLEHRGLTGKFACPLAAKVLACQSASMSSASPRLAVLIDGENVPSKLSNQLFEEIAALGEASVRRIYGDFQTEHMKGWSAVLAEHAILPQHFPTVSGKNSSDIAMVIDAMDLLHSGRFDGFCLVTSDGDFTRLATRIREHGRDVFGFGKRGKVSGGLVNACKRFFYLDAIEAPPLPDKTAAVSGDLVDLLRAAIQQAAGENEGFVPLSPVGVQLYKLKPDFEVRDYGHRQLSGLFRSLPKHFETQTHDKGVSVKLRNGS